MRTGHIVALATCLLARGTSASKHWQHDLQSRNSSVVSASLPGPGLSPVAPLPPSCIPDLPVNFRVAGLFMLMAMLLVWIVILYLMESHNGSPPTERSALLQIARPHRPIVKSLDGMRTVLIVYIIMCHFPAGTPGPLTFILVDPGWSMQFFMVLSGFVAYYTTENKTDAFDWRSAKTWLGRRLARLAALHHVALVADYARVLYAGGACAANGCRPFMAWPMNAMFLQGLFPVRICGLPTDHPSWNYAHFNANGVAWFAACLVWISIAFPVLYNVRPRSRVGLTLAVLCAAIALRCASELLCPAWAAWGGAGLLHPYAFVPVRLLEFWAGMLSAQVAAQAPISVRSQAMWGWAFDFALVTGFAGVAFTMSRFSASSLKTGEFYMVPIWCFVCAAASFVVQIPESERRLICSGPLHTLLTSTFVVYMAQYSYGTYQLHQIFLRWLPLLGLPASSASFPFNIIAAWLVGALVTVAIETPVMRYLEKAAREKQATT